MGTVRLEILTRSSVFVSLLCLDNASIGETGKYSVEVCTWSVLGSSVSIKILSVG